MFNVLRKAHQIIPYERIMLRRWTGSTTNDVGYDDDTYEQPVQALVKLNAVKSSMYKHLGLEYKKFYVVLHAEQMINGLSRVSSGDRFTFSGNNFQVQGRTGWRNIAGWDSFVCVQIPLEATQ